MTDNRPTLADRVEALETVVLDLMDLMAEETPRLRDVILERLADAIRDINNIDFPPDTLPDDEVVGKTPVAKSVKAIRDQFNKPS